jgi:hypothetical protein
VCFNQFFTGPGGTVQLLVFRTPGPEGDFVLCRSFGPQGVGPCFAGNTLTVESTSRLSLSWESPDILDLALPGSITESQFTSFSRSGKTDVVTHQTCQQGAPMLPVC